MKDRTALLRFDAFIATPLKRKTLYHSARADNDYNQINEAQQPQPQHLESEA